MAEALSIAGIVGKCKGGAEDNLHPRLWQRARVVGRDYVEERFVLDGEKLTIYRCVLDRRACFLLPF
jgi:hypothetical protein